MYISLLNNVTLLVSLSVVHSLLLRYLKQDSKGYQLLSGLLFGLVAVIGMLNSVEILPGIIFDGRSIILVTSGVFGGPVAGTIAIIVSSIYRTFTGGTGTLMGVLVILESGILGIFFYFLRKRYRWASGALAYYGFGLTVHIVMLALVLILPDDARDIIVPQILYPVLIIYPVATFLLLLLFQNQEHYLKIFDRLSESESALKEANKLAGLGRWYYDLRSDNLEWTDTIYELFEIDKSTDSPSYEKFLKVVHPGDRDMVDRSYSESLRSKSPYETEHRLLMKDGRVKWVVEKGYTQYDESGLPVSSTGIVQDITEMKKAKDAFEESQQMLRTIIDTIPVRVFWKDRECRYLGCNLQFARDAGFSIPEDLVGLDDYQMGWKDQADLYRKDDAAVIKSGISRLNYMEPQTTPDGRTLWLQTSKMPLNDLNNNIIGVLGTYEDITSRKKLESDLIVARDKARESDRLKTAFLNNLSHEIRTPLNAIVGFSELLNKHESHGQDYEHYTEIILRSSIQLLAIIDDIFDIAALEAGQTKLFIKRINVNQITRLVCEQFEREASQKGVKMYCNTSLPDEKALVLSDEAKLSQVLSNLVGNAVKYIKSGTIDTGYIKERNEIIFHVKDSGPGISAELHEIIFERFRQGDIDSKGEHSGSGLGLFISKSYVELLGGKIWLESIPGRGTEFFFSIPYNPDNEDSCTVDKEITYPSVGNKTILVAEDNSINFLLIKEYMSDCSAELIHAENGKEAVDHVRDNYEIDLVLMDIKMPVMDGFEATMHIKAIRPDLPVIALTAYAQSGDREKVSESGCDDYLAKPFNRNDLHSILNKYLPEQ